MLADSAEGCRIRDTSGVERVDWMMGWGPVLLGYRHPAVEAAIVEQLRCGPLTSLSAPVEIDVADRLRDMVPCAERVTFFKNGSDPLEVAVRLARGVTGREGVLFCGYHGFHDWYMASIPAAYGIPDAVRHLVREFPFGDLGRLEELLDRHGGRVAAVVMEPVRGAVPDRDYLDAVRRLATKHGVVLVFDEVLTAFRLAPGGAQEAFGIVPDLACLGKSIANGMPLAALVGKAEFMDVISHVYYGATFSNETLSFAAARAALDIYASEPVAQRVAELGSLLRASFDRHCSELGVPARLDGPSCRMVAQFERCGRIRPIGLATLFVQECLAHGVLTNGSFLPSFAHDDAAVAETGAAFGWALAAVADARERGTLRDLLHLPALRLAGVDPTVEDAP